jgi:hypothetical protein
MAMEMEMEMNPAMGDPPYSTGEGALAVEDFTVEGKSQFCHVWDVECKSNIVLVAQHINTPRNRLRI